MVCARLSKTLLAGVVAGTLAAGSMTSLEARPLPVASAATIAGDAPVDQVGWRHHGYYGGYGHYGWRRRSNSGALFAGAALGILGLAAAASIGNSGYYYGGYPSYSYGYGYPYYRTSYYYPAYYSYPRYHYYPRRVYYAPRVHYRHYGYRHHRVHYRHYGYRHHGGYRRAAYYHWR
jgi:hypothetical protein